MKIKRDTIEKRIDAGANASNALDMALFRRAFTPIEKEAWLYMRGREGLQKCISASKCPDEYAMAAKRSAECLLASLLKAIDSRDSKSIREVAGMVDAYPKLDASQGLRVRAHLVILKDALLRNGQTMTLQELANLVHYGSIEDNYVPLRRICKRMKFPLTQRGPGRPKIGTHKRK